MERHSFDIVSGESPEITVFFTVSINGLKSRSALTLISLISVFSKPCAYVAPVDVPWCCTRNWHSKKVSCYKCRGKIYWFFWIREWKLFFKSFYKLFVFTSCLLLQVDCHVILIANSIGVYTFLAKYFFSIFVDLLWEIFSRKNLGELFSIPEILENFNFWDSQS